MKIGTREFDLRNDTYIMGILNVTPDSFSDGGKWNKLDVGLKHVEEMMEAGADIIDVGGESTRPGYLTASQMLSDEDEIARVVPMITAIKKRFDIPVSVDTYKSGVAQAAIEVGADLVNDIWGLKHDTSMAEVIAKAKVPCCLMHNRKEAVYTDYLHEVAEDLKECISLARNAGIAEDKIILDPGIGFGKTYEQNLFLLRHLDTVTELGYPVLLGTSRKSVIGLTLNLPVNEREEGTLVTTILAMQYGIGIVRVHDVKGNSRAIRMMKAIREAEL